MELVGNDSIKKPGRPNPLKEIFSTLKFEKERLNNTANQNEEIRVKTKYLVSLLGKCIEIEEFLKKKQLTMSEIHMWAENILKYSSIITLKDTEEMWMYDTDTKKYVPNANTYIQSLCANEERANTLSVYKNLLMNIQGYTFKTRQEFESPVNFVNMYNGIYCLDDGGLYPHDPKYYFTYVLPYEYDPTVTCPTYMKVVNNLFPEEVDRITIQRWAGYQFVPGYPFQKYVHICGPSGAGKSALMHGFYTIIGKGNYTSYEMKDFLDRNTYAAANIYKKLANICADMSSASVEDMTMIKRLVSTVDVISARNIYKAPFEFVNNTKLTFVSNKMPHAKIGILQDDAVKRRAIVLKVEKAQFDANEEIFKKIEGEASGIFNWAMRGYFDLMNERSFRYNKDSTVIWAEEMDRSDENLIDFAFG